MVLKRSIFLYIILPLVHSYFECMKYLLIIVVFFVGLNCSAQDHVDGLYSYSVPTTACFLRSVYCGELRNMIGVTKNQVSHDEKEISNLYNA